MAQYLVLKTLPKGQEPGDTVELNDDEARVLMIPEIAAVRPIDQPEEAKARRRYQRRDLVAED